MSDQYDRLVYDVVRHKGDTDKAWRLLIRDGADDTHDEWFPKSQVDYQEGDDEIVLPRWLALERGLGTASRAYTQHDALVAGEPTPEIDRAQERQRQREAEQRGRRRFGW